MCAFQNEIVMADPECCLLTTLKSRATWQQPGDRVNRREIHYQAGKLRSSTRDSDSGLFSRSDSNVVIKSSE